MNWTPELTEHFTGDPNSEIPKAFTTVDYDNLPIVDTIRSPEEIQAIRVIDLALACHETKKIKALATPDTAESLTYQQASPQIFGELINLLVNTNGSKIDNAIAKVYDDLTDINNFYQDVDGEIVYDKEGHDAAWTDVWNSDAVLAEAKYTTDLSPTLK